MSSSPFIYGIKIPAVTGGRQAGRPPRAARRSPDLGHDADGLLDVGLGVQLGHLERFVAENDLGSLQTELLAQVGAGRMSQLVGVPCVGRSPSSLLLSGEPSRHFECPLAS